MRVEIHFSQGPCGSGELANLTSSSVFVRTSAAPKFRDHVRLRAGTLELSGEVALLAEQPQGFVLVFRDAEASVSKLSGVGPGIPVVNPAPRRHSSQIPLPPIPVARLRLRSEPARPPAPESEVQSSAFYAPGRFPELRHDGTLRFEAPADFSDQFRASIIHGGIIARSAPLSVGSMRTVRLVVPGIEAQVELRLRVGFVGEGSVGFVIERFPLERPHLESLLAEVARLA